MLYTHVAAALISAAIAATGAYKVQSWRYGEQIASMKQEASEATTKAVKAAMDKTLTDQKRKDDALIEANKREQKIQAIAKQNAIAANNANALANGLRLELAAARANLSTLSIEALRDRADRLSQVFEQCLSKYAGSAERYNELAQDAGRLASDLKRLDDSWPKP